MKLSRNKIAKLLKTGNQSRRRFRSKSLTNKDLILDVNTSRNNTSLTPSPAKTKAKTAAKTEKKHRQSMKKKRRGLNLRYKTLKRWWRQRGGDLTQEQTELLNSLKIRTDISDDLKDKIGIVQMLKSITPEMKKDLFAINVLSEEEKNLINTITIKEPIVKSKRPPPPPPKFLPRAAAAPTAAAGTISTAVLPDAVVLSSLDIDSEIKGHEDAIDEDWTSLDERMKILIKSDPNYKPTSTVLKEKPLTPKENDIQVTNPKIKTFITNIIDGELYYLIDVELYPLLFRYYFSFLKMDELTDLKSFAEKEIIPSSSSPSEYSFPYPNEIIVKNKYSFFEFNKGLSVKEQRGGGLRFLHKASTNINNELTEIQKLLNSVLKIKDIYIDYVSTTAFDTIKNNGKDLNKLLITNNNFQKILKSFRLNDNQIQNLDKGHIDTFTKDNKTKVIEILTNNKLLPNLDTDIKDESFVLYCIIVLTMYAQYNKCQELFDSLTKKYNDKMDKTQEIDFNKIKSKLKILQVEFKDGIFDLSNKDKINQNITAARNLISDAISDENPIDNLELNNKLIIKYYLQYLLNKYINPEEDETYGPTIMIQKQQCINVLKKLKVFLDNTAAPAPTSVPVLATKVTTAPVLATEVTTAPVPTPNTVNAEYIDNLIELLIANRQEDKQKITNLIALLATPTGTIYTYIVKLEKMFNNLRAKKDSNVKGEENTTLMDDKENIYDLLEQALTNSKCIGWYQPPSPTSGGGFDKTRFGKDTQLIVGIINEEVKDKLTETNLKSENFDATRLSKEADKKEKELTITKENPEIRTNPLLKITSASIPPASPASSQQYTSSPSSSFVPSIRGNQSYNPQNTQDLASQMALLTPLLAQLQANPNMTKEQRDGITATLGLKENSPLAKRVHFDFVWTDPDLWKITPIEGTSLDTWLKGIGYPMINKDNAAAALASTGDAEDILKKIVQAEGLIDAIEQIKHKDETSKVPVSVETISTGITEKKKEEMKKKYAELKPLIELFQTKLKTLETGGGGGGGNWRGWGGSKPPSKEQLDGLINYIIEQADKDVKNTPTPPEISYLFTDKGTMIEMLKKYILEYYNSTINKDETRWKTDSNHPLIYYQCLIAYVNNVINTNTTAYNVKNKEEFDTFIRTQFTEENIKKIWLNQKKYKVNEIPLPKSTAKISGSNSSDTPLPSTEDIATLQAQLKTAQDELEKKNQELEKKNQELTTAKEAAEAAALAAKEAAALADKEPAAALADKEAAAAAAAAALAAKEAAAKLSAAANKNVSDLEAEIENLKEQIKTLEVKIKPLIEGIEKLKETPQKSETISIGTGTDPILIDEKDNKIAELESTIKDLEVAKPVAPVKVDNTQTIIKLLKQLIASFYEITNYMSANKMLEQESKTEKILTSASIPRLTSASEASSSKASRPASEASITEASSEIPASEIPESKIVPELISSSESILEASASKLPITQASETSSRPEASALKSKPSLKSKIKTEASTSTSASESIIASEASASEASVSKASARGGKKTRRKKNKKSRGKNKRQIKKSKKSKRRM